MLKPVLGDERKTCHPDGVTGCSCPAIQWSSGAFTTMHRRAECADKPADDPQHYIDRREAALVDNKPRLVAYCRWCKGHFVLD